MKSIPNMLIILLLFSSQICRANLDLKSGTHVTIRSVTDINDKGVHEASITLSTRHFVIDKDILNSEGRVIIKAGQIVAGNLEKITPQSFGQAGHIALQNIYTIGPNKELIKLSGDVQNNGKASWLGKYAQIAPYVGVSLGMVGMMLTSYAWQFLTGSRVYAIPRAWETIWVEGSTALFVFGPLTGFLLKGSSAEIKKDTVYKLNVFGNY